MLQCSGEKLKPLVIGNTARPRAFKQNNVTPENLPVTWKHNKKAWMTTVVFEDWVNQLNETMKKNKRRIIPFVDNATSHVVSKEQCSCQVLVSTFNVRIAAVGSGDNSRNEGQLQKVYATKLGGCRREV